MLRRSFSAIRIAAVLAGILLARPTTAQTPPGRLIVEVVDPGGQIVPGATITVARPNQPEIIDTADASGLATFANLAPGAYTVTATLQGFQDAPPATIRLPERVDIRVTVKLGAPTFNEAVTVGAATNAPPPETSIGKGDLLELPPDPDVLQSTIDALGGFGSTVRVDGLSSGGLPPASTIQQIRIRQNSYDAEFHDASPAFVEIITSGKPVPWQRVISAQSRFEALQARNAFNPDAPSAASNGLYANLTGNLNNRASVVFFGNYNATREDQTLFAETPTGPVRGIVNNPQRYVFATLRIGLDNWHRQNLRVESDYQQSRADNVGAGGFSLPERGYNRDVTTERIRGFWTQPLNGAANHVLRLQMQHTAETAAPVSLAPATIVLNAFSSGGAQYGGERISDQLELTDVFTAPVGKHQVWRGGLLLWHGGYDTSMVSNAGGTFTFSSLASYTAGQPATFTQRVGAGVCCFGLTQLGLWIQDDIAATKTVNLALGLRQEAESHMGGFTNLAPRAQVEWSPAAANKHTTFRAGAGVFYSWLNPGDFEQTVRVDGINMHDVLLVDPSYPNPFASNGLTQLPSGRYLLGPNLVLPRTTRESIGVDQTAGSLLLHADYAHTNGTRLLMGENLNAPGTAGVRPDPQFANVIEVTSTGIGHSNALSTSLTYSNPKRGQFLRVNYSFSRAENDTDGAFFVPVDAAHPEAEFGPSGQDIHHRLSGNGSTILFRRMNVGSYWNYNSAPPYTITTGLDANGDGIFNERPTGIGRNSARAFAQFDQGVFLNWQFPRFALPPEQPPIRRVQLSVSATNVWNHVNRTNVSGVITSPVFGQAISANQPRRVYVGLTTIF